MAESPWTLEPDASLATHNTLRVAARAKRLATLRDATQLPALLAEPSVAAGEVMVLGEGSNVLFVADYPGTVIVMATRGVLVDHDDDTTHLAVAAGERWDDFVRWSLGQGYAGLENLIMIPGTVGAAPVQNIGAYGVEVAEFIDRVEAWDRATGRVMELGRAACAFGYRDSIFKHEPARYIVTAVRFTLPHDHALRLDYAGIRSELARMGIARPAPFHVADAVVNLRTRKLPDPAQIGNAGSFFKNPVVSTTDAATLVAREPGLPHWPHAGGVKLSAAWMIEACGFKGLREGDAGISNRHALVLVNHGAATGTELWAVAQRVRAGVAARFGVELVPEPVIIGADAAHN